MATPLRPGWKSLPPTDHLENSQDIVTSFSAVIVRDAGYAHGTMTTVYRDP